jgi:B9 domain-containing protein 1
MITGRLESAQCPLSSNNLYCRYSFQHGPDWNITHGVSSGVTQMGRTSWGNGSRQSISFNFPIDISFQTSNVAGWPRIAIAVYGLDMFGRDVARGYASMLCPMTPGISIKHAQLFVPTSSNICQRMLNWMNGAMPEFYDSKFVAQGEGRAATIVERTGSVKLILDVATKQMRDFGYVTDDSHMTTK